MIALNEFIANAPWPIKGIVWAFLMSALWVVASVPAYLLLAPFLRAERGLRAVSQSVLDTVRSYWTNGKIAVDDEIRSLAEHGQLVALHESFLNNWRATTSKVLVPIERLLASLGTTLHDAAVLEDAACAAPSSAPRLSEPAIADGTPVTRFAQVRVASWLLPVFLIVLVALITVNTGMLGEILSQLGVVPRGLVLFGVPLARLFAGFLTLIESSTGLAFGWAGLTTEPASGMPRRASAGRVAAVCAAAGFGLVEGFFYSRIGANAGSGLSATEPDPRTTFVFTQGLTLSEEQIFFGLGCLLVMSLFVFADACFEAAIVILRGHSLSAYSRALKRLQGQATRLGALSDTVRRHLAEIRTQLPHGVDLNPIAASLEELRTDIARLKSEPPRWASGTPTTLAGGQTASLKHRIAMWMCFAAVALAAFVASTSMAFAVVSPSWTLQFRVALAFGMGAGLAAAGFLMKPGHSLYRDDGGTLTRLTPITSTTMAFSVPIVIVALVLVGAPFIGGLTDISAAIGTWLFTVAGGVAVVLTCRELSGTPSLVFLLARRVAAWPLLVAGGCVWLGLRVASSVLRLLAWAVSLVAEPIRLLRKEGEHAAT